MDSSFLVAASEALARPYVRPSAGVDGRYESPAKSAAILNDMTLLYLLDAPEASSKADKFELLTKTFMQRHRQASPLVQLELKQALCLIFPLDLLVL